MLQDNEHVHNAVIAMKHAVVAAFPRQEFTVQRYAERAIKIGWVDGPTEAQVRTVIGELQTQVDNVRCDREFTVRFMQDVVNEATAMYGFLEIHIPRVNMYRMTGYARLSSMYRARYGPNDNDFPSVLVRNLLDNTGV
jgi:hypothetical protein